MTDQSGSTPQPGSPTSGSGDAPAQPYAAASGYQVPNPYGAPAQPPYGTQNQPPYGTQNQPPYGAPNQPPYGTHSPYAQSPVPAGYGAPGPAQAAYGYAPAQYPPGYGRPPERSGVLGTVGLAMVTIAGVAACAMGYLFGTIAAEFVDLALSLGGSSAVNPSDPRMRQFVDQHPWMSLGTPVFLLGLAGFIVCVVAFASRRGRKPALWGMILGVVLPIVAFALLVMAITPYVP